MNIAGREQKCSSRRVCQQHSPAQLLHARGAEYGSGDAATTRARWLRPVLYCIRVAVRASSLPCIAGSCRASSCLGVARSHPPHTSCALAGPASISILPLLLAPIWTRRRCSATPTCVRRAEGCTLGDREREWAARRCARRGPSIQLMQVTHASAIKP